MFPVEAFQRTIEKFAAIAQAIALPFHLTGGSMDSNPARPRLAEGHIQRLGVDRPTSRRQFSEWHPLPGIEIPIGNLTMNMAFGQYDAYGASNLGRRSACPRLR